MKHELPLAPGNIHFFQGPHQGTAVSNRFPGMILVLFSYACLAAIADMRQIASTFLPRPKRIERRIEP
ncbi:hypothetical protein KIH39_17890 [Telmatocola sphagniphila]|uniref:Uncharacterized protein n=1 Tax=Telmatocola sphagniphila TaxID=1123043 RepID=A0A8E6B3N4_9BACT|nr:hypothetical protein [Telmatocola sphagniphila]QVL30714.1 hypothetical protein KIH39_17890 [Telmatocola sphagniphila]